MSQEANDADLRAYCLLVRQCHFPAVEVDGLRLVGALVLPDRVAGGGFDCGPDTILSARHPRPNKPSVQTNY